MNNKNLKVQFGKQSFNLTASAESIDHFANWVSEYKHGVLNAKNSEITCNCKKDYDICRLKARRDGLLPVIKTRAELLAARS